MLFEALRLAMAIALLVVLPGWLLVTAAFPRREQLSPLERAYLVLAGGVLVLMTVGIVLGFLPHASRRGHLQSLAIGGMPNVELATLGVCALLAWIGLQRGAHAWLAARLPPGWRPGADASTLTVAAPAAAPPPATADTPAAPPPAEAEPAVPAEPVAAAPPSGAPLVPTHSAK